MAEMDWKQQTGGGPANYDDFLVPAMFAPLAQRMVKLAGMRPGMRVLDVACGTGALARAAALAVGRDGSVVGVDMGEPMLEIARSHRSVAEAAAIDFRVGDAAALPVENGEFDVATCQQGLQFFPDRPAALAELRRALHPGGTVAVATWSDPGPFRALDVALERHLGAEAGAGMRAPFALSDPYEVAGLVREAGFEVVSAGRETIGARFASHTDFARRAVASGPLAGVFEEASEAARQAIAEEVAGALAELATPDGGLRATISSVVVVGRRPI